MTSQIQVVTSLLNAEKERGDGGLQSIKNKTLPSITKKMSQFLTITLEVRINKEKDEICL